MKQRTQEELMCDYLYDAAYTMCTEYCVEDVSYSGRRFPSSEEILKYGCPKHDKNCRFLEWWDLLRKVRKGE